jgi:hypothetical protein
MPLTEWVSRAGPDTLRTGALAVPASGRGTHGDRPSAVVVDRDLHQAGARPLRRELRTIAHAGRTERAPVEHLDLGRPVPVQA